MKVFDFTSGKSFFLKLEHGKEIVAQLTEFLESSRINAAYVSGIGAVKEAEIGYYDQEKREYVKRKIEKPMEILSLSGNVSLKDGKVFPHLHAILGVDGEIYGGHLFNAQVFACELFIIALEGETPERGFDEQTGLYLWI